MTDRESGAARVPLAEVPGLPRLSRDYLEGYARTADFFNGDYRDPEAVLGLADAARRRPLRRDILAAVLREQNALYGAGPAAFAGIEALERDGAAAIVTGQQVGLFSGPLYTIYKAVTAVQLAEILGGRGRGRFVPVFWLASDDHDAAEIDHVTVLDRGNALRQIRCPLSAAGAKIPVGSLAVPGAIGGALAGLDEAAAETEFKAGVLAALARDYSPGRPLAEAFARWMARLFGSTGLVFVDGADPRLKACGGEIFRREIAEGSPSTRRALEASRRLKAAGYEEAVRLHEGILNLFLVDPERRTVQARDGGHVLKETGRAFAPGELAALAGSEPALFSPNVLLRPIYQDAILPTAAYVAGPGEIAYFAQTKGIYESFGLPMPVIQPRKGATLVERSVAAILSRYELTVPALWRDAAGALDRLAGGTIPEAVVRGLAAAREDLERDFAALVPAVAAFEPTLGGAAERAREAMAFRLETLEKKIRLAASAKDEIALRQIRRAVDGLVPGGKPQERVLNIVPFLIKHGFGLLGRLFEGLSGETIDHRILEL